MTEIQTALESFNGAMDLMNKLMDTMNLAIAYGLIIFIIASIIKLFVNRTNKIIILDELINILKYSFALFLLNNTEYILGGEIPFFIPKIIWVYLVANILLVLVCTAIFKGSKNKTADKNIANDVENNIEE